MNDPELWELYFVAHIFDYCMLSVDRCTMVERERVGEGRGVRGRPVNLGERR